MCQRLKASLLVPDAHKSLAVNHGCARLDAVIFAEVDLIHVNFLLLCGQVFAILVLCDRRDDRPICLLSRRPWQCRCILPDLTLNHLRRSLDRWSTHIVRRCRRTLPRLCLSETLLECVRIGTRDVELRP